MVNRIILVKFALIGLIVTGLISDINYVGTFKIKEYSELELAQQNPKVKILALYNSSSELKQANFSVLEGYLDDLGWVTIDFKESVGSYETLSEYDIVMVMGYGNLSSLGEFFEQFVLEGGSMLFLPPLTGLNLYNDFTRGFGVTLLDEGIVDNESFVDENTSVLLNGTWVKESPILSNVREIVLPKARPLNVSTANISIEFESYVLVWGEDSTISKSLNGSDIKLLYAVEMASGAKLIFYSTPLIAVNDYINLKDNRVLLINSVKWLAGKLGSLRITNVFVSGREAIKGVNSTLFINFTVLDQNGEPVDVEAKIYIVRLGEPLLIVNATEKGEGYYEANVSLEDIKTGTVELWIIVHKKYYGYYLWPSEEMGVYEILVYEERKYTLLPDPIITLLTLILPLLIIVLVLSIWYPKYKENRELIREIEGK